MNLKNENVKSQLFDILQHAGPHLSLSTLSLSPLSVSLYFPFPPTIFISLSIFSYVFPLPICFHPSLFLSLPHPSPLIFPFFPSLSDLLSHYYFVVSLTILLSLTLTSILFISFNTLSVSSHSSFRFPLLKSYLSFIK